MVRVANGDTLSSEGKCMEVPISMQGNTYYTDFYILTLGPILWDFHKLCMEFNLVETKHGLQGITPKEVSLMVGE